MRLCSSLLSFKIMFRFLWNSPKPELQVEKKLEEKRDITSISLSQVLQKFDPAVKNLARDCLPAVYMVTNINSIPVPLICEMWKTNWEIAISLTFKLSNPTLILCLQHLLNEIEEQKVLNVKFEKRLKDFFYQHFDNLHKYKLSVGPNTCKRMMGCLSHVQMCNLSIYGTEELQFLAKQLSSLFPF